MDRNPRSVVMTPFGATFLDEARRLLRVHDETALRAVGVASKETLELAVSDHAVGAMLPSVLAELHRQCAGIQLLVTVGSSARLFEAYTGGRFDAIVARFEDVGMNGRLLFRDRLVWTCAKSFRWTPGDPLPFVSLAPPCSVRDAALNALAAMQIAWRDVFIGMGVGAVQAAASAGLGIACLSARNMPADCRRLDHRAGLPPLPETKVVMLHRRDGDTMAAIASAFQGARDPRRAA